MDQAKESTCQNASASDSKGNASLPTSKQQAHQACRKDDRAVRNTHAKVMKNCVPVALLVGWNLHSSYQLQLSQVQTKVQVADLLRIPQYLSAAVGCLVNKGARTAAAGYIYSCPAVSAMYAANLSLTQLFRRLADLCGSTCAGRGVLMPRQNQQLIWLMSRLQRDGMLHWY